MGIGSNIGDRRSYIDKAVLLLKQNANINVIKISRLYETDPVGGPAQGKFLNGVIELNTVLNPLELLVNLQNIELKLGRIRSGLKNQPRTLDLDILLFEDIVLNTQQLIIPHPLLQERLFVLKPFMEIASGVIHPLFKRTIKELFTELNSRTESK